MRSSVGLGRALPGLYAAFSKLGWRRSATLDGLFRRAYFAYKRRVEDPFYNLARRSPELFRGGHVLDVGANIGYTASVFADAVDPGFGVFAFEPEGANFAALEALARKHRPGVIRPVRAAVGERDGEIELWLNETHPGDHRIRTASLQASASSARFSRSEKVRQVSIDGFLESMDPPLAPVRFIKIDVQGFELPVCLGMRRLLASARQPLAVAMEYDPAMMRDMGFDPAECLRFLLERGFELRVLEQSGETVPCSASELEAHLGPRGYRDLLLIRAARAEEMVPGIARRTEAHMRTQPTKRSSLKRLKRAGVDIDTVVDVGVLEGTSALIEAFPRARHLLFEPFANLNPRIEAAYAGVTHELHNVACFSEDGECWLVASSIVGTDKITHTRIAEQPATPGVGGVVCCEPIRRARLDSLPLRLGEHVLLKVDVDGVDLEVLKGAVALLARADVVVVEAPLEHLLERAQFLAARGFRLYDIVDLCYYHDILHQVDLLFVKEALFGKLPELSPWLTKTFSPEAYRELTDQLEREE